MLRIVRTKRFDKNFALCVTRGYDTAAFEEVAELLYTEQPLPPRCKLHKLSGKFDGCWDCHIKFDWVLIYRYDKKHKSIIFEDTGTHSDLFK